MRLGSFARVFAMLGVALAAGSSPATAGAARDSVAVESLELVHGPSVRTANRAPVDSATRWMYFHVESDSRIGIVVMKPTNAGTPSDAEILAAYTEVANDWIRGPYAGEDRVAFELPRSWFLRGGVAFDERARGEVFVAWVAFGRPTPHGMPGHFIRDSSEYHYDAPKPAPEDRRVGYTTSDHATLGWTGRLLSVVKVNLDTGRITDLAR